jgi:thioredoxin-dependent peroxiredoxin
MTGGAAHKAYGAWRLNKAYGQDLVGALRSTFCIDSTGVVRKVWPKVAKAAGHAEAVLAAPTQLVGG